MDYNKEKRQRPRARVNWPVVLQTERGDISGETMNLTVDGALVRCQESLVPDQTVEMVIQVPALVHPLRITAQVIHSSKCEHKEEVTYFEIGVRFAEISDKNKWLISVAVQRESGVMLFP